MEPENFIEVSFEVANKVGGIYQVLNSKSGKMKEYYGDSYITVGRYDEEEVRDDFNPSKCIEEVEALKDKDLEGIDVYCGVWMIPSQPACVLVDPSGMEKSADEIKEEMYEEHGVDSLEAGEEFDEPVKWSYAVGKVVSALEEELEGDTVVQLHEWLSGPAMMNFDSPSVFTTHATALGRALSNSDFDLQKAVEEGNIDDSLAEKYGVKAKHHVEKMATHQASVFTTVSKTTAEEAEAVLDREPDQVLPNGFNVEDFPSLEELSYQHKEKKNKMKEFLRAYFEPYYDINLENDPRILFISGRYEFHNKGLDIFIDALGELNQREGEDFFVFIFVPSAVEGAKPEVLENMSLYQELKNYVEDINPEIRGSLLNSLTSGQDPVEELEEVINETSSTVESLQRKFHSKGEKPPTSAFDLSYPQDEILDRLYQNGLENSEQDRVKVIFYPTYLSRGDKLLSMDYNDAIVASSAGIFPSYYEPWGYTPVETAANGALSVTTDMAGFGKFLVENTDSSDRKGIRVLERRNVDDDKAAGNLADMIEDIVSYSKTEITERKHNARKLAQLTSWDRLGENYLQAHKIALENR